MSKTHYILGLSGGKDSAALAIYVRERFPDVHYFFCDTGAELPETYEFLTKLEAYFGKPIHRLGTGRDFDHWLDVYRGSLPSSQMRWCTRKMKIEPLERWIQDTFGDDQVVSLVAIRADEPYREGYSSTRTNIHVEYPFRDDGVDKSGVMRILNDAGVGLPAYYEWRTRSGCYFCFYQRKAEWVGLAERHPELFERAVAYEEKSNKNHAGYGMTGRQFTWSQNETLRELVERKSEILEKHEKAVERANTKRRNVPLIEVLGEALNEDDDLEACQICSL